MISESIGFVTFYGMLLTVNYLRLKQNKEKKNNEDNQMLVRIIGLYISIIHSTITTISMFYCYFKFVHETDRPMNHYEELAYLHTFGYWIFDIILQYYNKTLSLFIFWHHIGAAAVIIAIFSWPSWVYMLDFTFAASEFTNPFNIARRIFDLRNETINSRRYAINIYLFGISFLILRLGFISYYFYYSLTLDSVSVILKIICIVLHVLFVDWSIQTFFLLWKTFPYLFTNSSKYENLQWWIKGWTLLQKYKSDRPCSTYLKIFEYLYAVGAPAFVWILYSK